MFDPFSPAPEAINPSDLSRALSRLCRFGGHVKGFWSVAEHSVMVARRVEAAGGTAKQALEGLLHDTMEGLGMVDLPSPIKRQPELLGYRLIEERVRVAVARRFGLPLKESAIVKKCDEEQCAWEMSWVFDQEAAPGLLEPRAPWESEELFLKELLRLSSKP
jgi:hypothetical protein